MIKVVVAKGKIPVKIIDFNEQKDEDAVKKAFIELDRATWKFETGQTIGLFQNDKLLRYFNDEETGWVHMNNNGIYEGLRGER